MYGGIGGGIQVWTIKTSGVECGNKTDITNNPDIHVLFGIMFKPLFSSFGIMGEAMYSRIIWEDSDSNDFGLMAGFYFKL